MAADKSRRNPIRSLRLPDESIEQLLDQLDRAGEDVTNERRSSPRYDYRANSCIVQLQQPGSSAPIAYAVSTRSLSASGFAFLHGAFVHVNTRCVIQLVSRAGAWYDISGAVVRCRHVDGLVHEVCVKFDHPIDPGEFCAAAQKRTVLVVEDDESAFEIAAYHLKKLNAEVTHAKGGKEALTAAAKCRYTVVFMDIDMPEMDGLETVRRLRVENYRGAVVAVTALGDQETREQCLRAGCDAFLAKPYTREQLIKILDLVDHEPLISSLDGDPDARELISNFVERLPAIVREMEDACREEDLNHIKIATRRLRAQGSSVGFEPISDAAAEVERLVENQATFEALRGRIQDLVRWCMLARASSTPQH